MADEKNLALNENQGDIIIYQAEDGGTKIDVRFVDETVWLTQQQIAELFQSSRTNIVEHIQHIYEEGELDEASTCRKFRQVRTEGNRQDGVLMLHRSLLKCKNNDARTEAELISLNRPKLFEEEQSVTTRHKEKKLCKRFLVTPR